MAEEVKNEGPDKVATETERCELCGQLKAQGDHENNECGFWIRVRMFAKAENGGVTVLA